VAGPVEEPTANVSARNTSAPAAAPSPAPAPAPDPKFRPDDGYFTESQEQAAEESLWKQNPLRKIVTLAEQIRNATVNPFFSTEQGYGRAKFLLAKVWSKESVVGSHWNDSVLCSDYSGYSGSQSPQLDWSATWIGPQNITQSYVVLVDDLDYSGYNPAYSHPTFIHWLFVAPGSVTKVPLGASGEGMPEGVVELPNSNGEAGYAPMCPPLSPPTPHQYRVRVWARTQSVASFVNDPNVRMYSSPIAEREHSRDGKRRAIFARSTEHLEEKLRNDNAIEYDSLHACAPMRFCHQHPLCNANGLCSFPNAPGPAPAPKKSGAE